MCPEDDSSERRKLAEALLKRFEQFTKYEQGASNRYLQWLRTVLSLSPEQVVSFLNAWYPISRHQPQILLFLTSLFPDHADRLRMFIGNIQEEDGYQKGYDPHYDLLGKVLIPLLGGTLRPNPVTDQMNLELHEMMMQRFRTPAQAAGALAAIEYPALDVSDILRMVVMKGGRQDVVSSNLYLKIHVKVEPEHIIDTHEVALRFMEQGEQQRHEVVEAFRTVMDFWVKFWPAAFSGLGYPESARDEAA
jgi:hypothetical protein